MPSVMKQFEASSHLFGANAPFVEELYERYLRDPESVDPAWRAQFDAWQGDGGPRDAGHAQVAEAFVKRSGAPVAPDRPARAATPDHEA